MKPLILLANAFINTFGITQPSERAANRAAWFIAILLAIVLIIVAIVGVVVFRGIYGH
jgi:heme/copper-type cytochrome/quinol oxidase subunit 2